MTMTRGTTTEGRRAPRLSRPSVRARITTVIAVLTAVSMAGAGLLVYALESARIDRQVHEQINQEIAEFRQLSTNPSAVDPETGEAFDDVARLLNVFLIRNVPDDDEMLVGYVTGQRTLRTPNRYGQEVLDDPAYREAFAALSDQGGTRTLTTKAFGEVWVTVVPVRNKRGEGALVLLNFLEDEHEELRRTMGTYALVALLALGMIVSIANLQSRRLLAPLTTLEETAREITATDISRRIPERGNDDITALTRTINNMLDRLEAGFASQRQFLDDAGHELRTPLTVLRGHLELLDGEDPTEVAETRDLLLDEIDRMSRLVGELIVLAKSRRPDFLVPSEVDVDEFTHAIAAKARGLGDRDWQIDEVGQGVARFDAQRLTQAVLQLADNAVKHTDAGGVIAIGSAIDAAALRLWVRDTGDGVPEADRQAIFERFTRSSVRDGDEGFGLGLSIVKAIVEAHGGEVHVRDALPRGAVFEMSLPTSEEPPWPRS
jgi:two-component system OmpR family sensor kinase